jgi:hypothetical protein
MFGFFFGALCIAGMVYVLRRQYAFGHRGGWYGGWHGSQGRHGWREDRSWGGGGPGYGPGRARRMLRWVYERLGTSPAQETVLADAAEVVVSAFGSFRDEKEQSRADLARALRSEPFDAEPLRSAFARHDERIKALRDVLTTQSARVHEVLDAGQRTRLAEFLERIPGRWNV